MKPSTLYADFEIVFESTARPILQILAFSVSSIVCIIITILYHDRWYLLIFQFACIIFGLTWYVRKRLTTSYYFDLKAETVMIHEGHLISSAREHLHFRDIKAVEIEQHDPDLIYRDDGAYSTPSYGCQPDANVNIILVTDNDDILFPATARIVSRRNADGRLDNPTIFRWNGSRASNMAVANSVAEGLVQVLDLEPNDGT